MKKMLMLLCVLCCLALTACSVSGGTDEPATTEAPVVTEAPAPTETTATGDATQAYLVITVANDIYQPILLTKPGRYTITRGEKVNVVEVSENSVCMAESNCDNQDCIYQGTVTLENKGERVLQNMILCIPNEVILELYTYEELKVALPGWEAQQ